MKWGIGTVRTYNRKTGVGVIVMDDGGEEVAVDLISSAGVRLRQGQRVRFMRIHRPQGIFAADVIFISGS